MIILAVYIPPSISANAKVSEALSEHYLIISNLQTVHPDGLFVAGDFNNASFKSVLPKCHQNIDLAMQGDSMLDLVYTNIQRACKVWTTLDNWTISSSF